MLEMWSILAIDLNNRPQTNERVEWMVGPRNLIELYLPVFPRELTCQVFYFL